MLPPQLVAPSLVAPSLVAPSLVAPSLVALHMGALHPVEQALVLLLAFGPFVLLALVVWLRRRAERREDGMAQSRTGDQAER